MKKLSCVGLALLLCAVLMLSACGPAKVVIPEGYQVFENGDISFAYPEGWNMTDGSTVILVNETGIGNNITVVYEQKTDMYAKMDTAAFEAQLVPAFETMGLSISNSQVTQTENDGGVSMTKITFNSSVAGASMVQTLYILSTETRTYTVTVTEVTKDSELVATVFDTLRFVE